MKIAVIGYAGAGKSTLSSRLADCYQLPLLHLDRVQFCANWAERDRDEALSLVRAFMEQPGWVIDGNYTAFDRERRLDEADEIIFLDFNRFDCFFRALRRYFEYRGRVRKSAAEGCSEKFDMEFVRWLLWEGRTKERRARFESGVARRRNKSVILKNQRELDAFLRARGISFMIPDLAYGRGEDR